MFLSRNLQELERLLRPEKQLLSALSLITHKAAPRRPAGDIAREEITRLLRREIQSGIRGFFGDSGDRDESTQNVAQQGSGAANRDRSRNGEALSGQKFMEAAFDEMVAGALLRGRRTSGVLSALFDLVPTLAGR